MPFIVYKALYHLMYHHHEVPGTVSAGVGAKSHHEYSWNISEHNYDCGKTILIITNTQIN